MEPTRRRFSRACRIEAVRLVTGQGHSLAQGSRDLDLNPNVLRRWKQRFEADPQEAVPGKGRWKPEAEPLRDLRRENERLRQERDIVKKAVASFSRSPR